MKVLHSSPITSFGGLNFVINTLDELGIGNLLIKKLPALSPQCKYNWRDIFYSYWSVFFCGGECAEDLSGNFKASLNGMSKLAIPSPDRVLNRLKELAVDSTLFTSEYSDKINKFAINDSMNQLNILLFKALLLNPNHTTTLDYDNTICFTNKQDATKTYKLVNGYQPGVAFIGSHVVYVENRTGNSPAQVGQAETLERMFLKLEKNNIKAKRFRADSASYGPKMIAIIERFTNSFYIRTRRSNELEEAYNKVKNWEPIGQPEDGIYRGETTYEPFKKFSKNPKEHSVPKLYRIIITKEKRRDGQTNLITKEAFEYTAIITNDFEMTANEVVCFYNQRGAVEKEFDILKNDFGWNNLPFSVMEQNNVYLLVMAMCRNIYHHLIHKFSKERKNLQPHYRLKKFIFRFICIPAKWIKHAGQHYLKLYGTVQFKT